MYCNSVIDTQHKRKLHRSRLGTFMVSSHHAVNIIPSLIPDCNQNPALRAKGICLLLSRKDACILHPMGPKSFSLLLAKVT